MSRKDLPLCCVGAGGHGKVVATQWNRLVGGTVVFADENRPVGEMLVSFPVEFDDFSAITGHRFIVTIGDNARRAAVQDALVARGLEAATLVADPAACFSDDLGAGTVVLAGAVVNPDARIGAGVIVNSCAVVEHDCVVGDFAHISPNATLAGGCRIGAGAWIGAGAVVVGGVAIAPGAVIGAGSVVTGDVSQSGTYVGVPARPL